MIKQNYAQPPCCESSDGESWNTKETSRDLHLCGKKATLNILFLMIFVPKSVCNDQLKRSIQIKLNRKQTVWCQDLNTLQ